MMCLRDTGLSHWVDGMVVGMVSFQFNIILFLGLCFLPLRLFFFTRLSKCKMKRYSVCA